MRDRSLFRRAGLLATLFGAAVAGCGTASSTSADAGGQSRAGTGGGGKAGQAGAPGGAGGGAAAGQSGAGGADAGSDGGTSSGCATTATTHIAPGGYYVNGNTVCTAAGNPHLFHGVDRPSLEWSSTGERLSASDFQLQAS